MKLPLLWFIAKTIDLTVTEIGLSKGFVELNPIFDGVGSYPMFLFNLLTTYIVYFLLHRFEKNKIVKDLITLSIWVVFIMAISRVILLIN